MGLFKRSKERESGNGASDEKRTERSKRRFSCFRKSETIQGNGTDESSYQTDRLMTPLSQDTPGSANAPSPLNKRTIIGRRLSFDTAQLLMTEAKIQEEIQNLTKNDSNESRPIRLMSEEGILLFEGLPDDIPDDKSLKEMIENASGKRLLTDKVPLFVEAPREYDPVASGFYKPRQGRSRSFYESDGEESMYESPFDDLMKKRGLLDDLTKQREVYESWQTSIEPSIEVVINAESPLWML